MVVPFIIHPIYTLYSGYFIGYVFTVDGSGNLANSPVEVGS